MSAAACAGYLNVGTGVMVSERQVRGGTIMLLV